MALPERKLEYIRAELGPWATEYEGTSGATALEVLHSMVLAEGAIAGDTACEAVIAMALRRTMGSLATAVDNSLADYESKDSQAFRHIEVMFTDRKHWIARAFPVAPGSLG